MYYAHTLGDNMLNKEAQRRIDKLLNELNGLYQRFDKLSVENKRLKAQVKRENKESITTRGKSNVNAPPKVSKPDLQPVGQKPTTEGEQGQPFCLFGASGSLHYDEELLTKLWYKRNPCHELNLDSGEDMFWKTAFMVFEDYVREVSRNVC